VATSEFDLPEDQVERLVAVMARLRAECPWTREQTHESLRRYLLEEAFEAVDAIDSGDPVAIKDELGDVLMQIVFHAAIAESGPEVWGFNDVAAAITEKLIHRSPHVFGDVEVRDLAEVDALWQRMKTQRAGQPDAGRGEAPAKLPALPALLMAQKHIERGGLVPLGDSIAEQLIQLVAQAHAAGIDAETALRDQIRVLHDQP
jgi:XTP/dITP diphosphohydrolase